MMNSMTLIGETVNIDGKRNESCDKCINLEAELLKSQNTFKDLLKSHSQLEKHCISLVCSIQLNQEIFQKDDSCSNQNALEILEFFENNDLKAQLQDKVNTICKLKDIIKSLREKSKEDVGIKSFLMLFGITTVSINVNAAQSNIVQVKTAEEFNDVSYKRGLASVEVRLVFYKKNEVMFCEQIAVLKRDITYKDYDISVLKCELEKLKKEKESNKLKLYKFENASKSLDKSIRSQISDNSRKGVGFPKFEGYKPKTSKSVSEVEPKKVRNNEGALIIEDWVSDDEEQEESKPKSEKKTIIPTVKKIEFVRPKQQQKPVRKPDKYAKMYRSQGPRGNQRNWNNQKSQQLG
ncbi:hypothetical protein Tco_1432446, partial [Tanacetum coccineum]